MVQIRLYCGDVNIGKLQESKISHSVSSMWGANRNNNSMICYNSNSIVISDLMVVWDGEFLQFERISHVPRETRIAFAVVANSMENVNYI